MKTESAKYMGRGMHLTVKPDSPRFTVAEQNRLMQLVKSLKLVSKLKKDFGIEDQKTVDAVRREIQRLRARRLRVAYLVRLESPKHAIFREYASVPPMFGPTGNKKLFNVVKELYTEIRKSIQNKRRAAKAMKTRSVSRYFNDGESESLVYTMFTHTQPGVILALFEERQYRVVLDPKAPKSAEHHVGVEIEFYSTSDQRKLQSLLGKSGLHNYVHLHGDGSIHPPRDGKTWHPHEISMLAPQSEVLSKIRTLCQILKDSGGAVNASCGLHVHIDMRNRDAQMAFRKLLNAQNIMYKLVPPSRVNNRFCKKTVDTDWGTTDRYKTINSNAFTRHGTIEIRLHNSTLDADKIVNWIELLIRTVESPLESSFRSVDRFLEHIEAPAALSDYVKKRVQTMDTTLSSIEEVERMAF